MTFYLGARGVRVPSSFSVLTSEVVGTNTPSPRLYPSTPSNLNAPWNLMSNFSLCFLRLNELSPWPAPSRSVTGLTNPLLVGCVAVHVLILAHLEAMASTFAFFTAWEFLTGLAIFLGPAGPPPAGNPESDPRVVSDGVGSQVAFVITTCFMGRTRSTTLVVATGSTFLSTGAIACTGCTGGETRLRWCLGHTVVPFATTHLHAVFLEHSLCMGRSHCSSVQTNPCSCIAS